jgi:hypothetical protein
MELIQRLLEEPEVEDVPHYRKRVRMMMWIYSSMFAFCIAGIVLIVTKGKLFVTLAQRTNVETLTIAFLLVFFTYLAVISGKGARATLYVLYFDLMRLFRGREAAERLKMRVLGAGGKCDAPEVALNVVLEREGRPSEPFDVPIRDEFGALGTLRFECVRISHLGAHRVGTYSLFPFVRQQIERMLANRGVGTPLMILEWKKVNDEDFEMYLNQVRFATRLEKHLGATDLWPKVTLKQAEITHLERVLTELCPVLREELFFPHAEYSGDHKMPIIPEPLGIINLTRTEKRVDPVSSMGAALAVVIFALALSVLMIVFPPWVPGA